MPNIDFYILKQSAESDRLFFTCRLIEKVFQQGRKVYIQVANQQSANTLSDLLWSFRTDSFIPHNVVTTEHEHFPSISIGFKDSYHGTKDVLINLSHNIPSFHKQFQRIAELVRNDESNKQIGREHWRFYQAQGYPLKKNEI